MAKYKRQKVKRYHRSFYSRGARIKRGVGILVLVLVVLGAAWLAAPHVLDWATHTWYTVVKNRDLHPAQRLPPKRLHLRRQRKRPRPSRSRNSPRGWTAGPSPAAAGLRWT